MNPPGDEKQRVASLLARMAASAVSHTWEMPNGRVDLVTPVSDGDDCAVLDFSGELSLVCGSDYIRGSKFALFEGGLLSHYDLGYYLVAANLSDIAAMGALPIGVLTVVRYPPDLSDGDFEAVLEGALEAAHRHGCELLGGDTGGAERLILSASALGMCERGTALLRSAARPGDRVFLTGSVGAPAAAIIYFLGAADSRRVELSEADRGELLAAWRRPELRVAEGRLLASRGLATACQDVSDGLRTTVEELAAASGVCLTIDEEAIPVDPVAARAAVAVAYDPLGLAMSASVDFELLFTTPLERIEELRSEFVAAGFGLHEIGQVTTGTGARLRRADGSLTDLPGVGWRHQDEDVTSFLRTGLSGTAEDSQASSGTPPESGEIS